MNQDQKLIRDKIPDIIDSNQQICQVKILSNLEYQQALKVKLVEEAQEVLTAKKDDLIEEIADVYEVIEALAQAHNLQTEEILRVKEKKAKCKGKFDKKIKLISVNKITNKEDTSTKITNIFPEVETFLNNQVLPQANSIDENHQLLKATLSSMNQINPLFFQLKLAKKWGGMEIDSVTFSQWQIMIAKYSGALAFLQTQHQSAVAMLSNSENEIVKEKYIPKIVDKNLFFGVGFSHLRKKGTPSVTALPKRKGYQVNGFISWITGYGIFSHFILGAILPTGEELYGLLPFQSQFSGLKFSHPLSLGAMNSTNTVSAELENYLLSHEDVIIINPSGAIHKKDRQNVLHHGFFPLGCSYGGLRILEENYRLLNFSEVEDVYLGLKSQVDNLKTQMLAMVVNHESFEDKLTLRIKAINLAYRCAIAATISSKGKANCNSHPANRIYREALVYSVSGQTTSVLTHSLQDLM